MTYADGVLTVAIPYLSPSNSALGALPPLPAGVMFAEQGPSALRDRVAELEAQLTAANSERGAGQATVDELRAEAAAATALVRERDGEVERLQELVSTHEASLVVARQQVTDWELRYERVEVTHREAVTRMASQLDGAQSRAAAAEAQVKDARASGTAALAEAQARIVALEQDVKASEADAEATVSAWATCDCPPPSRFLIHTPVACSRLIRVTLNLPFVCRIQLCLWSPAVPRLSVARWLDTL